MKRKRPRYIEKKIELRCKFCLLIYGLCSLTTLSLTTTLLSSQLYGVDEFEGGNAHDGESFFWDNRDHSEVQGSDSSGPKKRSRNSVLTVQMQEKNLKPAPKKRKCSAKSHRAEKREE